MDKLRAAATMALEALEDAYENGFLTGVTGLKTIDTLAALREALAEQALQKLSDFHQTMEQEPAGIVWDASAPVVMDSSAPKNENQAVAELRKQVAALKAVLDAWNNVEQEPVAFWNGKETAWFEHELCGHPAPDGCTIPLYTRPVRTKDLTDEEIEWLVVDTLETWNSKDTMKDFARAVIAKYKEKNK